MQGLLLRSAVVGTKRVLREENNHRELRKILPKGTSFANLTPRDVVLTCSQANSYARPSLGGVMPLTLASRVLPTDLIDGLGIELILPDDVVLKPRLINL